MHLTIPTKRSSAMSKLFVDGLEAARQQEGESTRSFRCGHCTGDAYIVLEESDPDYEKGFRYKCADKNCGILMRFLKPHNINFSD